MSEVADFTLANHVREFEWTLHCSWEPGFYFIQVEASGDRDASRMQFEVQICHQEVGIDDFAGSFAEKANCDPPVYELPEQGPYQVTGMHDPWQYDAVERFSGHHRFVVPDFDTFIDADMQLQPGMRVRIQNLWDRDEWDDREHWYVTLNHESFTTAWYRGAGSAGACEWDYSGQTSWHWPNRLGVSERDDYVDVWVPRCDLLPGTWYLSVIPPHTRMCDELFNYTYTVTVEIDQLNVRSSEIWTSNPLQIQGRLEGFAFPLSDIHDFSIDGIPAGMVNPDQIPVAPLSWSNNNFFDGPIDRYDVVAAWYEVSLGAINFANNPTLEVRLHGVQWGRRTQDNLWTDRAQYAEAGIGSKSWSDRYGFTSTRDSRRVTMLLHSSALPLGSLHWTDERDRFNARLSHGEYANDYGDFPNNEFPGNFGSSEFPEPDGRAITPDNCPTAEYQCSTEPDKEHEGGDNSVSSCRVVLQPCDLSNWVDTGAPRFFVGVAPLDIIWDNRNDHNNFHGARWGLDLYPVNADPPNAEFADSYPSGPSGPSGPRRTKEKQKNARAIVDGPHLGAPHKLNHGNLEMQNTLQDLDLRFGIAVMVHENVATELATYPVDAADEVSVTTSIGEGAYHHYVVQVDEVNRDNALELELFTAYSYQDVEVMVHYGSLASHPEDCWDADWSCSTASTDGTGSCVWRLEGCHLQVGQYYIAVRGEQNGIEDGMDRVLSNLQTVSYTLTSRWSSSVEVDELEVPHLHTVWPAAYNHYRTWVPENNQTLSLRVRISGVQNGAVRGYLQYEEAAGASNCFTYDWTCTPAPGTNHCDLVAPYCIWGSGYYYFSVYGESTSWTYGSPASQPRNGKIGYTLTAYIHYTDWVDWVPQMSALDADSGVHIVRSIPSNLDNNGIIKFMDDITKVDVRYPFWNPESGELRPHAALAFGHGLNSILGSEHHYYYFEYTPSMSDFPDGNSELVIQVNYVNHDVGVPTQDTVSLFLSPYTIANEMCNCWTCTAKPGAEDGWRYCKIVLQECDLLPNIDLLSGAPTTNSGGDELWYLTVRYDQYDNHASLPLDYTLDINMKGKVHQQLFDGTPVYAHASTHEYQHYFFDATALTPDTTALNVELYINRDFIDDIEFFMAVDNFAGTACPDWEAIMPTCEAGGSPGAGESFNSFETCSFKIHPCELQAAEYWFSIVAAPQATSNVYQDGQVQYTLRVWSEEPFALSPQGWPVTGTVWSVNHYRVDFDDWLLHGNENGRDFARHLFVQLDAVRSGSVQTWITNSAIGGSCGSGMGGCASDRRPYLNEFEVELDHCQLRSDSVHYISVSAWQQDTPVEPVRYTLRSYTQRVWVDPAFGSAVGEDWGRDPADGRFLSLRREEHIVIPIRPADDPQFAGLTAQELAGTSLHIRVHNVTWGTMLYWVGSNPDDASNAAEAPYGEAPYGIPSPSCNQEHGGITGHAFTQYPLGTVEDLDGKPADEIYLSFYCDVPTTDTFYLALKAALVPEWERLPCDRTINSTINVWLQPVITVDNTIYNSAFDTSENTQTIFGPGDSFSRCNANIREKHATIGRNFFDLRPQNVTGGPWPTNPERVVSCSTPLSAIYPDYYRFTPIVSGWYDFYLMRYDDVRINDYGPISTEYFLTVFDGSDCSTELGCAFGQIPNQASDPEVTFRIWGEAGHPYDVMVATDEVNLSNLGFPDGVGSFLISGPFIGRVPNPCNETVDLPLVGPGAYYFNTFYAAEPEPTSDDDPDYRGNRFVVDIPTAGLYRAFSCEHMSFWDDENLGSVPAGFTSGLSCFASDTFFTSGSSSGEDWMTFYGCNTGNNFVDEEVIFDDDDPYIITIGGRDNQADERGFGYVELYRYDKPQSYVPITHSDEFRYFVSPLFTPAADSDGIWNSMEITLDARGFDLFDYLFDDAVNADVRPDFLSPSSPYRKGNFDAYIRFVPQSEIVAGDAVLPGSQETCGDPSTIECINTDFCDAEFNGCELTEPGYFYVQLAYRSFHAQGRSVSLLPTISFFDNTDQADTWSVQIVDLAASGFTLPSVVGILGGTGEEPFSFSLDIPADVPAGVNVVHAFIDIPADYNSANLGTWGIDSFSRGAAYSFDTTGCEDSTDVGVSNDYRGSCLSSSSNSIISVGSDHAELTLTDWIRNIPDFAEGFDIGFCDVTGTVNGDPCCTSTQEDFLDANGRRIWFSYAVLPAPGSFVSSGTLTGDFDIHSWYLPLSPDTFDLGTVTGDDWVSVNNTLEGIWTFSPDNRDVRKHIYAVDVQLGPSDVIEFNFEAVLRESTVYWQYGVPGYALPNCGSSDRNWRWDCTDDDVDSERTCYFEATRCSLQNGQWYVTVVTFQGATIDVDYRFEIRVNSTEAVPLQGTLEASIDRPLRWVVDNDIYDHYFLPWQNWAGPGNFTDGPAADPNSRFSDLVIEVFDVQWGGAGGPIPTLNCSDVEIYFNLRGPAGDPDVPDASLQNLRITELGSPSCLANQPFICEFSETPVGCPRRCRVPTCELDEAVYFDDGIWVSVRSTMNTTGTYRIQYYLDDPVVADPGRLRELSNNVPLPVANVSREVQTFWFDVDATTPQHELGYLYARVSVVDLNAFADSVELAVWPEDHCGAPLDSYTCDAETHYFDETVDPTTVGLECRVQFDPCAFDVFTHRRFYLSVTYTNNSLTNYDMNFTLTTEVRQPRLIRVDIPQQNPAPNVWTHVREQFLEDEWHFYHFDFGDIVNWQHQGNFRFEVDVECAWDDAVDVALNARYHGWHEHHATVRCNEWYSLMGLSNPSDSYYLSACDWQAGDVYVGLRSNFNGLMHPNYTIPIRYSLRLENEAEPEVREIGLHQWTAFLPEFADSCTEGREQMRVDWRGHEWGEQVRIQVRARDPAVRTVCPRWRHAHVFLDSVDDPLATLTRNTGNYYVGTDEHFGADCDDYSGCVALTTGGHDGDWWVGSTTVVVPCDAPGENTWLYLLFDGVEDGDEVRILRERKWIPVIDLTADNALWAESLSVAPNQWAHYKLVVDPSVNAPTWRWWAAVEDVQGVDRVELTLSRGDLERPRIAGESCFEKSLTCRRGSAVDECVLYDTWDEATATDTTVYWISLVGQSDSVLENSQCLGTFDLTFGSHVNPEVDFVATCEQDCHTMEAGEIKHLRATVAAPEESVVLFDVRDLSGSIRVCVRQGWLAHVWHRDGHCWDIDSSDFHWHDTDEVPKNLFDPLGYAPAGNQDQTWAGIGFDNIDDRGGIFGFGGLNKESAKVEGRDVQPTAASYALFEDEDRQQNYEAHIFSPFRFMLPCMDASSEEVYFSVMALEDSSFTFQIRWETVTPQHEFDLSTADSELFEWSPSYGSNGLMGTPLPGTWSLLDDLSDCSSSLAPAGGAWPNVYKWDYAGDRGFGWNLQVLTNGAKQAPRGVTLYVNDGSLAAPFLAASFGQFPGIPGLNPLLSRGDQVEGCSVWPDSSNVFDAEPAYTWTHEEHCDLRARTFYFYVVHDSRPADRWDEPNAPLSGSSGATLFGSEYPGFFDTNPDPEYANPPDFDGLLQNWANEAPISFKQVGRNSGSQSVLFNDVQPDGQDGTSRSLSLQRYANVVPYTLEVYYTDAQDAGSAANPLTVGDTWSGQIDGITTFEYTHPLTANHNAVVIRLLQDSLDNNDDLTVWFWAEGDNHACRHPEDIYLQNWGENEGFSNCRFVHLTNLVPGGVYYLRVDADADSCTELGFTVSAEWATSPIDYLVPILWDVSAAVGPASGQLSFNSDVNWLYLAGQREQAAVYQLNLDQFPGSSAANFLYARAWDVQGHDGQLVLLTRDLYTVVDQCFFGFGASNARGLTGNCAVWADECEVAQMTDNVAYLGVTVAGANEPEVPGYNRLEWRFEVTYDWQELSSSVSSSLNGLDRDFYHVTLGSASAMTLTVDVHNGPAVRVLVKDNTCGAESWSHRTVWCHHDACSIELSAPSQHSSAASVEYYVTVDRGTNQFQKDSSYTITLNTGLDLANTNYLGRFGSLDFCDILNIDPDIFEEGSGAAMYGFTNLALKNQEAEGLFNSLLAGEFFGAVPSAECLDRLAIWACLEAMPEVELSTGFILPTCRQNCIEVQDACGHWLSVAGLPEFSCDTPRYKIDAPCTGLAVRIPPPTTTPPPPIIFNGTNATAPPVIILTTTTGTTTTTSTTTSSTTTTGSSGGVGPGDIDSAPALYVSFLLLSLSSLFFFLF